jgi:hypothetical protein
MPWLVSGTAPCIRQEMTTTARTLGISVANLGARALNACFHDRDQAFWSARVKKPLLAAEPLPTGGNTDHSRSHVLQQQQQQQQQLLLLLKQKQDQQLDQHKKVRVRTLASALLRELARRSEEEDSCVVAGSEFAMYQDPQTAAKSARRKGLVRVWMALQVKDQAADITRWLLWHLLLGVERFLVYDNESGDGLAETLAPFIEAGLVRVVIMFCFLSLSFFLSFFLSSPTFNNPFRYSSFRGLV